jgi:hypothetical protein
MKKIFILIFLTVCLSGYGQLSKVPMGVGTKLNVAFPIINLAIDQVNANTAAISLKTPITNASMLGLTKLTSLKVGNTKTGSTVVQIDSITVNGGNIYFYNGATILTAVPGTGSANWGSISGSIANQIDLTNALNAKANTSHTQAQSTITALSDSLLARYTKTQANTLFNLKANTSALSGYVPTSRTVNGHALTGNVSVTAADLSLGNVTNESKATMFTNSVFTGTHTIPSPFTLGATSVTTTGAQFNYSNTLTSNIQTQFKRITTGFYNVLTYGADSTGGVSSSSAIQSAINTAKNISANYGTGATVYIPAGTYLLSVPMKIYSNVTIEAAPNARFNITGAPGYVWTADDITMYANIRGGFWFLDENTDFFKVVIPTGNYIQFCDFENMVIKQCKNVFEITLSGTGWFTGVHFTNIKADEYVKILKVRPITVGDNFGGNVFTNISCQSFDGTRRTVSVIDSLGGSYNMFVNLMNWDFNAAVLKNSYTVNLTASSHDNYIWGGALTVDTLVNDGEDNMIYSDGQAVSHFSDSLLLYGKYGDRAIINKLTIGAPNAAGSTATPAGDIGIKLRSYMTNVNTKGSNYSVRIVGKNSASENRGSFMYLQTHGIANNENESAYVDALKLDPLGNADTYGAVNYVLDNSAGSNDTYTATITGFGFVTGKVITFHPLTANTDGCTLNINGGGAKAIVNQVGSGLTTNDMVAIGFYPLCWNGTNWTLMTK